MLASVPTATVMHDPVIFEVSIISVISNATANYLPLVSQRPYEFLPKRWLAVDSYQDPASVEGEPPRVQIFSTF
jgi:hypothetical protein